MWDDPIMPEWVKPPALPRSEKSNLSAAGPACAYAAAKNRWAAVRATECCSASAY